jgi:hypothetical protein
MQTIEVHNKKEHAIDIPTRMGIRGIYPFTFGTWHDVKVRWAIGFFGEVISINVTSPITRAKTYRYIHKSFCSIDLKNRYLAQHGNMNGW